MKTIFFLPLLFGAFVNLPAQADFGAMDLVEMGRRHPGSIAGFIDELPEDILRKAMLVVKSRSNQTASRYDPRVIMFNKRVTLAYTGYRYRKEDTVEMAEFDPQTKLYDFYSLKFTGREFTYEKNPFLCQVCHRGSLRPIWPGMMVQPWFAGLLGAGHTSFLPEEEALYSNFLQHHRENPVYRRLIGMLRPGKDGWDDLYANNKDFDDLLDDQMVQFSAHKLLSHPNFNRIASAFMMVLSMRTNYWITGGKKLDLGAELAPLLGEPADQLRGELEARAGKAAALLHKTHQRKWILHKYAVESQAKFQREDFLDVLAKFVAGLQLVLERGHMGEMLDQAMSLSFHEDELEFLGVNLNPWFYFGKLERELLTQLQDRSKLDFLAQRKIAEEFGKPPIRFSVWRNREASRESLAKLHSSLCEMEVTR